MAPHPETASQQYIRKAASNAGLTIELGAGIPSSPSPFLRALISRGTDEDRERSMRLLAARDTDDDRVHLRRLLAVCLQEEHPTEPWPECYEAAGKVLARLRGAGLKR